MQMSVLYLNAVSGPCDEAGLFYLEPVASAVLQEMYSHSPLRGIAHCPGGCQYVEAVVLTHGPFSN